MGRINTALIYLSTPRMPKQRVDTSALVKPSETVMSKSATVLLPMDGRSRGAQKAYVVLGASGKPFQMCWKCTGEDLGSEKDRVAFILVSLNVRRTEVIDGFAIDGWPLNLNIAARCGQSLKRMPFSPDRWAPRTRNQREYDAGPVQKLESVTSSIQMHIRYVQSLISQPPSLGFTVRK